MSTTFTRFRAFWALSISAYTLLFGAVFGYATFGYGIPTDHPTNEGLLFVWIGMALVGSLLAALKNSRISTQLKPIIFIADLLVPLALIILVVTLPVFLGLIRSLVVIIVAAEYILLQRNWLFKGKLIETP